MSGHCIESEDFVIVIDKWDASFLRRPGCKPHYFFLTHLHADHIKGLTSTWSRIIYTSPFNAWLLPMRRNVKPVLLKEIDLNVTHTIRKSNNEVAFQVTLLDANHCPGAVMFLFQGTFGNILYTGDFRYSPKILDNPVLSPIIRNKELNVLYLDNTYAAALCKFPAREEALKQVLKIVDENPDCKILIGMRQLGKEEVLRAIALHVNEKVCVSTQRLQILSKLEYEDVFTTDTTESRIHAVELHTITQRHSQELSAKVVSIKLTSMYECGNMEKQRGNIYVVPYSDHSSHTELLNFVDQVRPLKLYPIVQPKIPKMTGDMGLFYRMSTVNCVIPEEILQLCGPPSDVSKPPPPLAASSVSPTFSIKFHPPSKIANIEKKSNSIYIDEGMNFLPLDLGSHLTNNNKARKHIKASWTRLAPKILSQRGIKFQDSSPEKSSGQSEEVVLKLKTEVDHSVHGLKTKEDNDLNMPLNDNIESLTEVPLSDDELDMPSSARELGLRMQFPSNSRAVNGMVDEELKSECSSELTGLATGVRRTRSSEKFEIPAKPVTRIACNDSDSVVSTRSTRSKSSVSSLPVSSRPRTRSSLESQVDSQGDRGAHRMATRSSPKGSPNAQEAVKRSSTSPRVERNGLPKKSISLENLSMKSFKEKAVKKETMDSKEKVVGTSGAKDSPTKMLTRGKTSLDVDVQKASAEPATSSINPTLGEVPNCGKEQLVSEIKIEPSDSRTMDKPPINKKLLPNGSLLLSNFNGIHINSPGRKRVPLSCDWDAAQEIAKKETEQALKALETLNELKGFKTRNVGNRPGLVALRRLSADNIPVKSPVKNQRLVVLPVSPTGLRSRTASILSSMADTFSKPSKTKASSSSSTAQLNPTSSSKVTSCKSPAKEMSSSFTAKQNAPSSSTVTPCKSPIKDVSSSSTTKQNATSSSAVAPQKTPVKDVSSFSTTKLNATSSSTVTPVKTPAKDVSSTSTAKPNAMSSSTVASRRSPTKEISPIVPVKESKKLSPKGRIELKVKDNCTAAESQAAHKRVEKREKTEKTGKEFIIASSLPSEIRKEQEMEESSFSQVDASRMESEVIVKNDTDALSSEQIAGTDNSQKTPDVLNQGLFLTDDTLASASSSKKSAPRISRRGYHKKQNDVNVDLMRLKVGFAMTTKCPKRLSLPSRLISLRRDKLGESTSPFQNKEKVQDWRKKLSLTLRRSPQRRYRFKSPNKLRESAKRNLATILRSGRSLANSQGYQGDVEDCLEASHMSTPKSTQEEISGYTADVESSAPTIPSQSSDNLLLPQQLDTSDSIEDSKIAVQNELRRSSRVPRPQQNPKSVFNISTYAEKALNKNKTPVKILKKDPITPPSTAVSGISPIQKSPTIMADLSPTRFSDRLSQRSRTIFRKSADSSLTQNSPKLLSLMADAFKKTVPLQPPTATITANILSSMAENFKKLDEGAQVSPSLSIQLIPAKSQRPPLKGQDLSDWGVQITRVDSSSSKSQSGSPSSTLEGSPISAIPKSLSIEIIPENSAKEPVRRKGPSPPTITISPEVIDLSSDNPEEVTTQSTIHSLPISPGSRMLAQGGSRWQPIAKSEIMSPPQAVWKEKRSTAQTGDKVIIDIQTQEDPQKVPHCPVHCSCGATSRQGTCMGTMRNLIEADADCLYEVPLSPEEFEDSGAMLALGKGWIESCFEDEDDREDFMSSYEGLLPNIADSIERKSKQASRKSSPAPRPPRPPQAHVRQVFASKQTASNSKQLARVKPSNAPPLPKKTIVNTSKSNPQPSQNSKRKEVPKKRLSTDSVASNKTTEKRQSLKTVPSRRSSSQSTSSSSSAAKSRSSKQSGSPLPPPPVPLKRRTLGSNVKNEVKKEKDKISLKRKNVSSTSSPDSPESKKARNMELARLTIDMGKSGTNKTYRMSVRRSLDHLMTRQKLRSDRRVKTSTSSST